MLQGNVANFLAAMGDVRERNALMKVLQNIADRMSCVWFNSSALRIKGGSASPTVQTNAAGAGLVAGVLVTKASATDVPALSGTVTNAKFNVFAVFIDNGGTLTSVMGTEGATLATVVFPPIPANKTCIGYVIVNPTGTGNFVGGTTVLDDGTVTPNAVFVNTIAAFDPMCLPGPYTP
jgi:hypothetical protein